MKIELFLDKVMNLAKAQPPIKLNDCKSFENGNTKM